MPDVLNFQKLHEAHARVGCWMNDNASAGECRDERNIFYFRLLAENHLLRSGVRLLDLGGGLSWFAPMVREMGLEVAIADDFGGGGGVSHQSDERTRELQVLDRFRQHGIEILELDFVRKPLPLPDASIDVITCFHSLEHWHYSPKLAFAEAHRVLRSGGVFILATPNAVNLRKRIAVVLGWSNWPDLRGWYDDELARGHIREPIMSDLQRLLEWNGFEVLSTSGRNFIGRDSHALAWMPRPLRHGLAIGAEMILRFFPTLCSDLHVVGRKT